MTLRRAAKVDANQKALLAYMDKIGFHVEVIKEPVDVVLTLRSHTDVVVFAEVKNPEKAPNQRRLKPSQMRFYCRYPGYFTVLQEESDALALALAFQKAHEYRDMAITSVCNDQLEQYFLECYKKIPLDLMTGQKLIRWGNWCVRNGGPRV